MDSTPKLKIDRFAQLHPGELFLFEYGNARCVGLVAEYRDPDPQNLLLPLGPIFPGNDPGPRLMSGHFAAVSFGRDFTIRLPVDPKNWTDKEPDRDCNCLTLSENGLYFRANGNPDPDGRFVPCFLNAANGVVEVIQGSLPPGRFTRPAGTLAFALAWEILTTEAKPRTILKYPFPIAAS
jgi:hypothetical protein